MFMCLDHLAVADLEVIVADILGQDLILGHIRGAHHQGVEDVDFLVEHLMIEDKGIVQEAVVVEMLLGVDGMIILEIQEITGDPIDLIVTDHAEEEEAVDLVVEVEDLIEEVYQEVPIDLQKILPIIVAMLIGKIDGPMNLLMKWT